LVAAFDCFDGGNSGHLLEIDAIIRNIQPNPTLKTAHMDVSGFPNYLQAMLVLSIKRGLQNGLSRFFGRATRAAVIYSTEPADSSEFLVCDTTGLLTTHKDAIQEHFSENGSVLEPKRFAKIPGGNRERSALTLAYFAGRFRLRNSFTKPGLSKPIQCSLRALSSRG
jgi:hypothetical protein